MGLNELTGRSLVAHQDREIDLLKGISIPARFIVRVVGSMVVSQSCLGIISPSP